ncbi:G-protein alpha subunit-domain-containing protein [Phellopilus nigrolimitatus]|nr:G-protein alpha subunit-domain-containing protein [Phellopilus nigrolimitatus]
MLLEPRCYSNRAWAKLSELPPRDVGRCECALGDVLEWPLWVIKGVSVPKERSCSIMCTRVQSQGRRWHGKVNQNGATSPSSLYLPHLPSPCLLAPLARQEARALALARAATLFLAALARHVNNKIDELLRPVKMFLLGQSKSGKSTTLKNFQLAYALGLCTGHVYPQVTMGRPVGIPMGMGHPCMGDPFPTGQSRVWEECASWRAIVQLNLLRSVILILDILQSALAGTGASFNSNLIPQFLLSLTIMTREIKAVRKTRAVQVSSYDKLVRLKGELAHAYELVWNILGRERQKRENSAYLLDDDDDAMPPPPPAAGIALSETHKLLRLRLAPLRRVQADLERRLGSSAEEPVSVAGGPPTVPAPFDGASSTAVGAAHRPQEFFVRSSTGWKSALDHLRPRSSSAGSREEDMHALWTDSVVRQLLTVCRLHLKDSAGFFLDDVQRVAMHEYELTDDDIAGQEWLMYNVGWTHWLRQAWAPFFDDINTIIFLAPIRTCELPVDPLDPHPRVSEDPRIRVPADPGQDGSRSRFFRHG